MSSPLFDSIRKELEARKDDIRPSDIILFSEPLRTALNAVIHLKRFSLTEFAANLPFTREETKLLADLLIKRNLFELFAESPGEPVYMARLSAMTRPLTRPPTDLWKKID
ncbi:MAG TPA: hypothetical protein PKL78_01005 [Anaerolineales bacterium]|nr:hypothetical protein [Anaerolineales bacterium]HNN12105.1 hypothetical protein [Anaerolineales bacterium]HNO30692.1 hypothetical protein [Anaerolineales bacterium]